MKLWKVLTIWRLRGSSETMVLKLTFGALELYSNLLCGVPPFWAETETGVAQAIIKAIYFKSDPWPKVTDNAKNLVKKMLKPNPKSRLTVQQVLDLPWLRNGKKAPDVPLGGSVRARLLQFSGMNKLKKKALKATTEHLSAEEEIGLKEGFQVMDRVIEGRLILTS